MERRRQKREDGGGVDRGSKVEERGEERDSKREREAVLQCSGFFPRAVLLLVNKQNTGLS